MLYKKISGSSHDMSSETLHPSGPWQVRSANRVKILNVFREHGPLSRVKLRKLCDLSAPTTSRIVDELLNDGLLEESGEEVSTGGRRPVLLDWSRDKGLIIALNIGESVRCALMDLSGKIIEVEELEKLQVKKPNKLIPELVKHLRHLVRKSRDKKVYGIGVGIPGKISGGTVLASTPLNWGKVELSAEIESKLKLPVLLDDTSRLGALGEHVFAGDRTTGNLAYVYADSGFGAGLLIHGKIFSGHNHLAGEIGHLPVPGNDLSCSCGKRGCLETLVSKNSIAKRVQRDLKLDFKTPNKSDRLIETWLSRHQGGDKRAEKIFEDCSREMGRAIAHLLNCFDPSTVILGGFLSRNNARPFFERIREHAMSLCIQEDHQVVFSPSSFSDDGALIGAGALVYEDLFSEARALDRGSPL